MSVLRAKARGKSLIAGWLELPRFGGHLETATGGVPCPNATGRCIRPSSDIRLWSCTAGRSVRDLAREFEPSVETIAAWVRQAGADAGRRPDLPTSAEREKLSRLRRENHCLRQERDILATAAAWFAGGRTPSGPSGS